MKTPAALFAAVVSAAVLAAPKNQKTVEADGEGNVIETGAERKAAGRDMTPYVIEPLGPEAHQTLPKTLPNRASYLPRKEFRRGMRLFGGGGRDAVIVCQHGPETQRVMNELRWHLEKMIGRDVKVLPGKFPTDGSPAITVRYTGGPDERSVVRVEDGVLFIEGSDAVGMSHALTYVLEALGCRYLWPGDDGKVIPRRNEVYLPEGLALDFVPTLKVRRIRTYYACHENRTGNLDRFGLDVLKLRERNRRLSLGERIENRSFWEWHGLNDSRLLPGGDPTNAGAYRWEHRFNDYYLRFGKDHPEWFALQVDGTRNQDNRPTFCMTNAELVDQMAKETIELFKADPSVISQSLCLPDGGYHSYCMCEKCRALDPKNVKMRPGWLYYPYKRPSIGHSLTDRVFHFKNAIAEKVHAAFPEKKLSVYVYSSYVEPPLREKPHPMFVLISVAGGYYNTPESRAAVGESLAAWGSFGNEFIWRPNALGAFRCGVPMNNARWFYEDIETMKANGLKGTDFDCMSGAFALQGLTFYTLAKVHLNPDRLSYDDVYADWLQTAFGRGADAMKDYFDELEAAFCRASVALSAFRKENPASRDTGADMMIRAVDLAKLGASLAAAETAAEGDSEALRRLAFFRKGYECAVWEKKAAEAVWAKSKDAALIQRQYAWFVRETVLRTPFALSFGGAYLGRDPLGL